MTSPTPLKDYDLKLDNIPSSTRREPYSNNYLDLPPYVDEMRPRLESHFNRWIDTFLSTEPINVIKGTQKVIEYVEHVNKINSNLEPYPLPNPAKTQIFASPHEALTYLAVTDAKMHFVNTLGWSPDDPLLQLILKDIKYRASVRFCYSRKNLVEVDPSEYEQFHHTGYDGSQLAEKIWATITKKRTPEYQDTMNTGSSGTLMRFFLDWVVEEFKDNPPDVSTWRPYVDTEEHLYFWWLRGDELILVERPLKYNCKSVKYCDGVTNSIGPDFDNPDEPTIIYKDGNSFAFRDSRLVFPAILDCNADNIFVEDILREDNVTLRNILIARYGADRFFNYLCSKNIIHELDSDDISAYGQNPDSPARIRRLLFKVDTTNPMTLMIANDGSTDRIFYLYGSPDIRTCKEFHELSCGFEENSIKYQG